MRWIKASENLPPMFKTVYLKDVSTDGSVVHDVGELKVFQAEQPYFSGTSRMYPIYDPQYSVYWLDESQPTPSTLSPEIGEGGGVVRHVDIPSEDMAKLYKCADTWNKDFAPFVLKGLVQGYLLAIGKLPRYHYDEAGYCGTHDQPFYNACPLCNPDNAAAHPTETPATGEVPAIPKMSDELAAMADVAAIEYGKDNGQRVCREEDDYDNSPDLTDAFLAGQSWMYHKMQDVITMVTETSEGMAQRNAELGEEIDRLKASLEESRNDAKVFQEWYRRGDENIIVVTEEAADYRKLLDELFPNLSLQEKEAVAPVLDKYTKK